MWRELSSVVLLVVVLVVLLRGVVFDGFECKSANVLLFENYYRPGRDKGFSKSFDLISN